MYVIIGKAKDIWAKFTGDEETVYYDGNGGWTRISGYAQVYEDYQVAAKIARQVGGLVDAAPMHEWGE